MKTAKEFFKDYADLIQHEEGDAEYLVDEESFTEAMIEFAKMHVEATLKAASEKCKVQGYTYNIENKRKNIDIYGVEMSVDEICSTNSGLFVSTNKNSILNSYSLDNIK